MISMPGGAMARPASRSFAVTDSVVLGLMASRRIAADSVV